MTSRTKQISQERKAKHRRELSLDYAILGLALTIFLTILILSA